MRNWLLGLVFLAVFLAPAPAWAAWCNSVEEYAPEDLSRIQRFMYLSAPARLAPVMRSARVELVDDDPLALSMQVRDGAPVVLIPKGFRQLHCRLVMLSALLPRSQDERSAQLALIRDEILKGFRRSGSLADTLNRVTGERLARIRRPDLSPDQARAFEAGWTTDAMKGLLLHEVIHIEQAAERSDPDRAAEPEPGKTELEFRADWDGALLAAFAGVNATLANIYNFEILASVDSLVPAGASGHARFACRKDQAANIHRALQYGPMALARVASASDPVWSAYSQRIADRRSARGFDMSDWAFSHSPGCEPGEAEAREQLSLHAVKSEMAAFHDLQEAILDVGPGPDEVRVPYLAVRAVLSHQPRTATGRRLRVAIALRYLEMLAAAPDQPSAAVVGLGVPLLSSYGLDDALTHDYARIAWIYKELLARPAFAARATARGHSDASLAGFEEAVRVRLARAGLAPGEPSPFLGEADGVWRRDAPTYVLDLGAGLEPGESPIYTRFSETGFPGDPPPN